MNLFTSSADSMAAGAYLDRTGFNATPDSFATVVLRAAGAFGGGIALTTLLAAIINR